jgi:hypothetical protein
MLAQQHSLIDDYRPQGQQRRARQALHRHLHAPLKNGFEQAIEGVTGLRPQCMADLPHLHAAIAMGIRSWPGRDQLTAPSVALLP